MSGERSWATLHPEVLNLIRQRLLREDYLNFRATCRNWNFKALFDPVVYENVKYPFLLNFSKRNDDDHHSSSSSSSSSCCEAYSHAYDKSYYIRAHARLSDAQIHCSSYGWLLLSKGERIFFYHPSTESIIYLPLFESHQYFAFNRMGFSAPPTSPDCVVFGLLDKYSNKNVYTTFIQRGRGSWIHSEDPILNLMTWAIHRSRKLITSKIEKKIRVVRNRYRVNLAKWPCIGEFLWSNTSCPPVFNKGAFFCLAQDGRLGVFKHRRKLWGLLDRTCRPELFLDNPYNQSYLMECKGDLMSIVVGPMGEFVRVLNFYEPARTWQVAYHVKNQMVFLSSAGCVVLPCDDDDEELLHTRRDLKNTIHFPRFRGNHHVFYSISTEQFHSFEIGYPPVDDDLSDTKLLLNRAWMVPNFDFFSGPDLDWSSEPQQRATITQKCVDNKVERRCIHPHYVIRNSTFLSSRGTCKPKHELDEDAEKRTAPTTQPCLVLSNEEGDKVLVNLAKETRADNHSRNSELATKMRGKNVYMSSDYGPLVLIDVEARRCCLLDPVSMVETLLPAWEKHVKCSAIVLHSTPGESKFVVMVFGQFESGHNSEEDEEEEEVEEVLGKFVSAQKLEEDEVEEEEVKGKSDAIAMLWRDGDNEWTLLHSPPKGQGFEFIGGVVVHQGKMYGYAKETFDLVSIQVEPERYTTELVPELDFTINLNGSSALVRLLVELDGELYLFVRYEAGSTWTKKVDITMDIRVFKLDSAKMMRWRKVADLGDRAFFWSRWGCYPCCASKMGFQRNAIYFLTEDNDLYIFDYGERSISGYRPATFGGVDDDDNWVPDGFIMCSATNGQ